MSRSFVVTASHYADYLVQGNEISVESENTQDAPVVVHIGTDEKAARRAATRYAKTFRATNEGLGPVCALFLHHYDTEKGETHTVTLSLH